MKKPCKMQEFLYSYALSKRKCIKSRFNYESIFFSLFPSNIFYGYGYFAA
jgi:hypothetical protein